MPGRIRRRDDVSPLAVKREKRLSFAESVQWVGEWDALSVVDLVQRNKTGQASCRERICRRDDVSPLAVKREKRLSFGESVHCAGESVAGMGECSPLAGALTVILPAHPASRGAEAIPAQRERRSRRAWRLVGGTGYFPGVCVERRGILFFSSYGRETGRRRGGFCAASSFHPP